MAKDTKKVNVEKQLEKIGNKFIKKSSSLGINIPKEEVLNIISLLAEKHKKCIKKKEIDVVSPEGSNTCRIKCNRCESVIADAASMMQNIKEDRNSPESLSNKIDELESDFIDLDALIGQAIKRDKFCAYNTVTLTEVRNAIGSRKDELWETPAITALMEKHNLSKDEVEGSIAKYINDEVKTAYDSLRKAIEKTIDELIKKPEASISKILKIEASQKVEEVVKEVIEDVVSTASEDVVDTDTKAKKTATKAKKTK